MADVFYEVDEQLRSARLKSLFRRGWPFGAGLLVLLLVAALSVWAWRAHEAAAEGENSQRYADAMQILSAGDVKTGEIKFAALAKDGTPAYRALALMQQAGIRMKVGDALGAAALLDQAASASHDKITVDGAKLRAAFLLMDSAPYDRIRARLEPLTGAGRPFHMLAREGLAVAELASGRTAEAKGDLQVLSLSSDVSDAARARAQAALAMIQSGAGANLTAIAKAAVGLKPAPPPATPTAQQAAALQAQAQGGAQTGSAPADASAQTSPGATQ
ncbi:tetratricopeptide repeat protein [Caulobacter sp. S45]|uniref:tetratricopeptide repeat protein n=1 Tax=Caulobacter sp. S45 TaxID=1641861 RepID=UPI0015767BAC|nr:tetratricopeptide repeat protein [Caulobacter sp. S45]